MSLKCRVNFRPMWLNQTLLDDAEKPALTSQKDSQMADKEMIAATLAAGLLAGRNFAGSRGAPEDQAVATYQRVLAALNAAIAPAQPRTK